MRLTVAGVVLGLALTVPVAQALRSQLVGIGPTDTVSFAGSAVLLLSVGLTACLVPARRAARLDPVRALRAE
jgi:ABC-type antimicrobial peptide transport system permease subunit